MAVAVPPGFIFHMVRWNGGAFMSFALLVAWWLLLVLVGRAGMNLLRIRTSTRLEHVVFSAFRVTESFVAAREFEMDGRSINRVQFK